MFERDIRCNSAYQKSVVGFTSFFLLTLKACLGVCTDGLSNLMYEEKILYGIEESTLAWVTKVVVSPFKYLVDGV